jgi:hypothetical protein
MTDQENRILDEERRKIVKWLSRLNYWQNQDDTFERRQEGTGEWLLNDSGFQSWIAAATGVL